MDTKVFGCKVNKFYINKWLEYFAHRPEFSYGNKAIIATCVVTDRAKAKWVKDVRKRLESGQEIYLTGCGAFEKGAAMDYEKFFNLYPSLAPHKESLFLLGEDPDAYQEDLQVAAYDLNREPDARDEEKPDTQSDFSGDDTVHEMVKKTQGETLYDRVISRLDSSDNVSSSSDTHSIQEPLYTRKFIVIQSGCDTFCTFCLTIHKRGSNRNRPAQEIIDEINAFVEQGGKEIILTGVNLAAYGSSNTRRPEENRFSALLQKIIDETSVPRIRISSLGPEFLDDAFFALMENERFLPHFHFSIQSFSDIVLQKMNRNYGAAVLDDVLTKIRKLQRPDADSISIGADIIVGFPYETQEEFQKTFDALERYGVTKLHAFPFSPHQKGETVVAGSLSEQVPIAIKKQRERALLAEGERIRDLFLQSQKGKTFSALLEMKKNGKWTGWTENYMPVALEGDFEKGEIIEISW